MMMNRNETRQLLQRAEKAALNSAEICQISLDTSEINELEDISREIAEAQTYRSSKVIWHRGSILTITLKCSQCYALIQSGRERAPLCNTREERIVCGFIVLSKWKRQF